jgi:hypothetical protein
MVLETLAVLVFFRPDAIPSDEEQEEERQREMDEKALSKTQTLQA